MSTEAITMSDFTRANFLTTPTSTRSNSVSPRTASPNPQLRGISLFRAISRKLSRYRRQGYEDDSTDSDRSSSSEGNSGSGSGNNSPDLARGSGKQPIGNSLKKVLQSLSLTGASGERRITSCSSKTPARTSVSPKRILRQPVAYSYIRGPSGLPTIRVPKKSVACSQVNNLSCWSYDC